MNAPNPAAAVGLDTQALALLKGKPLFPFISPPNGGKGTQTSALSDHFGLPRIDMGAMLREIGKQDTPLGRRVSELQAQGALVDTPTVVQALQAGLVEILQQTPGLKGFILDGFPRNDEQAQGLFGLAEATGAVIAQAIYLSVPDAVIIERAANRRFNPNTGQIFSMIGRSGPDAERDSDGTPLIQRPDDHPDKVKVRLDSFARDTLPILERFRAKGLLADVDGNRPVEVVTQELIALLAPHLH